MKLEEAKALQYGDHIFTDLDHYSSGKPITVKVNGKPKVWKRRPQAVSVPVKYGLYDY